MIYKHLLQAVIVATCLMSTLASGQSIYQQQLVSLNPKSLEPVQTLAQYQGKPMLTSFFMPNCNWCFRQHKVLKAMQKQCPDLQTVMLGVQGSKLKLRKELKREKNTFPAFVANHQLVNAIGDDAPVPMMVIFDEQGQVVFKTVGYTKAEKLKGLLKKHEVLDCS